MIGDDDIKVCEQCGASVYQEHLDSGIARQVNGKLLCAHCLTEYEESGGAEDDGGMFEEENLAPIEFEEDDKGGTKVEMSSTRIHLQTEAARGQGVADEGKFKRLPRADGVGATRCRMFHCRISQGATDFMVNQINEWLDQHNDITLKFATTTIGMFEGKHTEPNLITTVFY